ncbi:MAG: hypothetical protein SF052_22730 [Bacteroidia bacterium]|nr:hypothetical protein [Bacteroidia bacterium]
MSQPPAFNQLPAYTSDLKEVIESEKLYIRQRRAHYKETHPEDTDTHLKSIWGMAVSGGGIRAATLSLGVFQKLIVEGFLRKVDYMSTVSGGGYMGACLSTLLNNPPDKFVKPGHISPDEAGTLIPGLDAETSPLVLLMETRPITSPVSPDPVSNLFPESKPRWMPTQMEQDSDDLEHKKETAQQLVIEYAQPGKVKMDARHQIHHLRAHGEYLSPEKSIFSPAVQRLVGAVFAGIVHNILLFALALTAFVSINYITFDFISGKDFFHQLAEYQEKVSTKSTADSITTLAITDQLASFWSDYVVVFGKRIKDSLSDHAFISLTLALLGMFTALYFIFRVGQILRKLEIEEMQIQQGKTKPQTRSGHTIENYYENLFTQRFNTVGILGGPILTVIAWFSGKGLGYIPQTDYWIIFGLPAAFAAGLFLAVYLFLPFTNFPSRHSRIARSMDGVLRGGALYSLLISIAMPVGILLLFSFSFFFNKLFITLTSSVSSLVSIGVGYLAVSSSKVKGEGIFSNLLQKLKIPAITLSMILFVVLAASAITSLLITQSEMIYLPGWLLGGSLFLFITLGIFVNSNRLSLHYFYRDRLSEAFLKTDGRVIREKPDRQGKPKVNLRNDENLRVKDMGWKQIASLTAGQNTHPENRTDTDGSVWEPYPRSPYHIVVTALNLQGSNELVRKDLKSEHFIFSRNYTGSGSTGYVRSDVYREGKTKLSRAMTISAAAVSSGMGMSSFFAQTFITTLLNLRLGYWTENPWKYRNYGDTNWKNPKWKYTFWPYYLIQELLGFLTADQRLVNVSDGGHTGDNLGLLPLLQRRCKYIIVCDFEEDHKFLFESFSHAIRMANIEENIDIEIDLTPLIPLQPEPGKITPSTRSVVIGKVGYPDKTFGTIFYLKSSLNQEPLPVSAANYHSKYPDFPHQSTADQFFDDAQFEAYRSLGFHIARQAAREIRKQLEKDGEIMPQKS